MLDRLRVLAEVQNSRGASKFDGSKKEAREKALDRQIWWSRWVPGVNKASSQRRKLSVSISVTAALSPGTCQTLLMSFAGDWPAS